MMGMKEEMMGDAMDDAFADEEEARGGGRVEGEVWGCREMRVDGGRIQAPRPLQRGAGRRRRRRRRRRRGGMGGRRRRRLGGLGLPHFSAAPHRIVPRLPRHHPPPPSPPPARLPRHRRPHPSADPPVAVQDSEEEEDCLLEV